MAKNSFPMPGGGSGALPKIVGFLALAVLVVFVLKYPAKTAEGVRAIVDAVITFVSTVAG